MKSLVVYSVAVLLPLVVACGNSRDSADDDGDGAALVGNATPRAGATIDSPNADPTKSYWGARRIDVLQTVGYLDETSLRVARRADGILDLAPADGKFGVDELVSLERPEHLRTLFPEEKAAIPKLWKILEVDAATHVGAPATPIQATTIAAYPTPQRTEHAIVKLSDERQQIARRIELTHDDDNDPTTISSADIQGAYAEKGSYLPTEVTEFETIDERINEVQTKLETDAQRVEVQTPASSEVTLFELNGVSLRAKSDVSIQGNYRYALPGQGWHRVTQSRSLTLNVGSSATVRIVALDPATGTEDFVTNRSALRAGRFEVWDGGSRAGAFDVDPLPADSSIDVPFGYAVILGGTIYGLDCDESRTGGCTYTANIARRARGGSFTVADQPGRRVDVFPSGRAVVVENGTSRECYPQPDPEACVVFDDNWYPEYMILFGHHLANDSPDLGIINQQRSGLMTSLYPL